MLECMHADFYLRVSPSEFIGARMTSLVGLLGIKPCFLCTDGRKMPQNSGGDAVEKLLSAICVHPESQSVKSVKGEIAFSLSY